MDIYNIVEIIHMPIKKKIYPIILAGGSGSRLWPLSRKSKPKQYINFFGADTLFQKTLKRFSHELFEPPIIITNNQSRFMVKEQLNIITKKSTKIIIEPAPKNTAPASLAGIIHSNQISADPYILISPSDHLIKDEKLFSDLISKLKEKLPDNKILLFGIKPSDPNTGFGWINAKIEKNKEIYKIKGFVEKPNIDKAKKMFELNSSYWNTGIFFGKASAFIKQFQMLAPDILSIVSLSYENSVDDLNFLRLDENLWNKLPVVPIDVAIMEKSDQICVTPLKADWTDLGSWKSFMGYLNKDKKENVFYGNVTNVESQNSFLYSTTDKVHLVGIGLKNVISIATEDAVLVVDKDKTEEVKNAINLLKEKEIEQAENFLHDFRPWGFFEILSKGENFLVKKIVVYPKKRLSLQKHKFRSEHWVVVEGKAKVQLNEKTFYLSENESTYVNSGMIHRLENETNQNLIIIEVQTGSYLGEDDIVRIEDDFKR